MRAVSAAVRMLTVVYPSEGEQSMKMKSNLSRTLSTMLLMTKCPFSIFGSSVSAATRSMLEGSSQRFLISGLWRMTSSACFSPTMHSYMPSRSMSNPSPDVAFACGSASSSRTLRPSRASEAARFMAVVVLPTPPFWFAKAITLDIVFVLRIYVCKTLSQAPSAHSAGTFYAAADGQDIIGQN